MTRGVRIGVDLLILSLAFWIACLLRFEFQIPPQIQRTFLVNWPCILALQYTWLVLFGVPRMAWRYINIRDVLLVLGAMAASTSLLVGLRIWGAPLPGGEMVTPFSVIAFDFVLSFVGLVGVRATWRIRGEVRERAKRARDGVRNRVLLIGAGEAGVLVARELSRRPDLGLQAVGFVDDDPRKVGTTVAGLSVLGTTAELADIATRKRAKRALITIASASGGEIRRITSLCRDAGVQTKIIPGIHEIVGDKVNLSRIREVAIEDLLGREPISLDEAVVGATIRSRVVLVTGAGGSIGSELCRHICRFGPQRLVLAERFENALFEIHRELKDAFPDVMLEPRVADICDVTRMNEIFSAIKPDLVFHAAAHKHVPMMEWNPGEAVKNNVGGTKIVADLADAFGVERFVLISTDKAVNPTSVMGATKRVAEIYTQALAQRSRTRFVTVRFGNVLGSAGSVIPIFRQQITAGGPVTVTHPDMTRYFMTIPEASQLVLQAGSMGCGGEIFILDMGEPVRIVDLARDLISLSGLRPMEDIEMRFSGVRPGEKLHEELATDGENADKTRHPKIFIGRVQAGSLDEISPGIVNLLKCASGHGNDGIKSALRTLVPEYQSAPTQAHAERETGPQAQLAPEVSTN